MKRLFLTLCFGVAALLPLRAQMQLTLDEALNLALSENPTIKVAEMEVDRFDYVKMESWGALIPQVSVGGTYTRSIVKQEMARGLSFGADNTIAAVGNVNWNLFAPTVFRTLKMNRTQLAAAVEDARASRVTLVAEVKKAFYNILLAEQSLEVLRESEATVKRTVDDTRLLYDHGLASEYDWLTAQVQLSNLKPTIIQTENSIEVAKLLLKMYLSIPEEVEIEVVGKLDEMRDAVLYGADTYSTDVSQNTSLRALDFQEELLTHQLKISNAARWPVVSAFLQATYTGNDLDMSKLAFMGGGASGGEGGEGGMTLPGAWYWQHPISAGLQLSIPLFSGLTRVAKARQIKNQMAQLSLQKNYAREQIGVQVRSSINDLLTARETMFAQEQTVAQAEKAYKISDTRFRAGAGTILELNTAQLAMTQAHLNFSQAIYDYLSAKAEYDRIVGREE